MKYNSLQTSESRIYSFQLIRFCKGLKLQAPAITYSAFLACALRETIPPEMMQ